MDTTDATGQRARVPPPLVGREAERAVLLAALAEPPAIVVVSGEPGSGKTRLVQDVLDGARESGSLVLEGACVALSAPVPYLPLTQALRRVSRELPAPGPAAGLSPELARGRLFAELLDLLAGLGGGHPVVLAIEDLQWADRSTLDVLRFLAAALRDEPLSLVLTARSPTSALGDAAHGPRARLVALGGLDEDAVGQLLAALGAPVAPETVAAVARRSGGNPFFVEQLAPLAAAGEDGLPERVRDVVLGSLAGLQEPSVALLELLAVAGGRLQHDVLAAALPGTAEGLDEALRACLERSLVAAGADDYRIRHVLVQEAVAAHLLPGERRRVEAALAGALEGVGAPAGVIAARWAAAGLPARALPLALQAADAARVACAFPEAHDELEAALSLAERLPAAVRAELPPRAELLARAGEAAIAAGRFDAADRRLDEALAEQPPAPQRALLLSRIAFARYRLGHAEASFEARRQAAALVRDQPASAMRAMVLSSAALALALSGEGEEARRLAEEALADAREVWDVAEEGRAHVALGLALSACGETSRSVVETARGRELAIAAGDEEGAARAAMNLSWQLVLACRPDEGAAVALAGLDRARASGLGGAFDAPLRANALVAQVGAGRVGAARALLGEPRPRAADRWGEALLLARGARVWALAADDAAADEALAAARQAAAALPPGHDLRQELALSAVLAHVERGEPEAALELALAGVREGRSEDVPELAWLGLRAAADAAERARALRRLAEAERLRDEGSALLAVGPRRRTPYALALDPLLRSEAARLAGETGPGDWRAALAALAHAPDGPPGAYAAFRLAESLAATRAPAAELRAAVQDALARAHSGGLVRLERELHALGRRRRVDTAASGRGDDLAVAGLTRREVEILRHLAAGHTNRRIAQELVISERTAAHHVSSILAKLEVRTRGEAASIAHRVGLAAAEREKL